MKFVPISSLQKTTKPMLESDVVCVLRNSEPAFYTIPKEMYDNIFNGDISRYAQISDMINIILRSMSDRDIEQFFENNTICKSVFKKIVFDIGVNYADIGNSEELKDALEV